MMVTILTLLVDDRDEVVQKQIAVDDVLTKCGVISAVLGM